MLSTLLSLHCIIIFSTSNLDENTLSFHIQSFQVLGDAEGFVEQMEQLRVYEVNKEMKRPCSKAESEDMLSFKSK